MLSIFPELFDFSFLAVTLLRVVVGYFFWVLGLRLVRAAWAVRARGIHVWLLGMVYGIAKTLVGIFLVLGIYTQAAAMAGAILAFITYLQGASLQKTKGDRQVQLLLVVICVSLLFLGPGALALDLPL